VKRALPPSEPTHSRPTAPDVDAAILDLLARLPLTWKPLDVDGLSAVEQEALLLLTAGGLVERRFSVRLQLIGQTMAIEATVTATGEYGLVEGFEPVAKAAWQVCRPGGSRTSPRPCGGCGSAQ